MIKYRIICPLNDNLTTFRVKSVSYTHLDVYKRQPLRLTLRCYSINFPNKADNIFLLFSVYISCIFIN